MKIEVSFIKMSGAGNDFIVIDNFRKTLNVNNADLAVALCSRRKGIGADGLLLLGPSLVADFFMKYFNADGSYGGMCGNGGRCIARFAYLAGIASSNMKFEALDYVYHAEVKETSVRLSMKAPNCLKMNLLVREGDSNWVGSFIDTGSPHFVLAVDELETADVCGVGRAIRYHSAFEPEGCNVNFVSTETDGRLSIRTYERGVEDETLACGTGSVASAIVFASKNGLKSPITLNVRSGEQLVVHFRREGDRFAHVVLEGSARIMFSGTIVYDTERACISDLMTIPQTNKS